MPSAHFQYVQICRILIYDGTNVYINRENSECSLQKPKKS